MKEISPNTLSFEFLKEILWIPKFDEWVENYKAITSHARMDAIYFDKKPTFLNFIHSFKLITLIMLFTFVLSIVVLIFKIWRR